MPHLLASRGHLLNVASLAAAAHPPLLSAYAASKAGVEALSDSVRQELAPAGVSVGCAYFSFIDTDMVRDGFDHPGNRAALGLLPGFLTKPAPLGAAVEAIAEGIVKRKPRVWAPRHVGPALVLRGLLAAADRAALDAQPEDRAGRLAGRGRPAARSQRRPRFRGG